jgi:hypothetical protein
MIVMTIHLLRALRLALPLVVLGSAEARAAGPMPLYLYEQLDDARDRDLEAESFLPRATVTGGPRASAYLALGAHVGISPSAVADVGAVLLLQLPIDRAAAPRLPIPEEARRDTGATAATPESTGLADDAMPAPLPPPKAPSVPEPIALSPESARACVAAAWRAAGMVDDHRLEGLGSRARASAALPELRLRAARTVDESGRVTLSETDPSRYTEVGGATHWLEARLTFRLDRLLFADEEVSLERIRLERTEARARIAAKALRAFFEWQRAELLARDPNLRSDEHFAAILSEIEAAAVLDVLTDGWFTRFRAGTVQPR